MIRQVSASNRLYLTPADQGRQLTLEEYQQADYKEGYRYELIKGRLEVSPRPNLPHEEFTNWLSFQLSRFAHKNTQIINKVLIPAQLILSEETEPSAPQPDLAAYRDFPDDIEEEQTNWQDINPVLVVEVFSPDSEQKDLVRNLEIYLLVPSIREYWIIDVRADSRRPSMTVYRRRGQRWQRPIDVPAGGTYATKLLPGFTLVLDRRKPANAEE